MTADWLPSPVCRGVRCQCFVADVGPLSLAAQASGHGFYHGSVGVVETSGNLHFDVEHFQKRNAGIVEGIEGSGRWIVKGYGDSFGIVVAGVSVGGEI